jgi:hypothetical protein
VCRLGNPVCPQGYEDCDRRCVPAGSCGVTCIDGCAAGQHCVGGTCRCPAGSVAAPPDPSGLGLWVASSCVDPDRDAYACGTGKVACGSPDGGSSSGWCDSGTCRAENTLQFVTGLAAPVVQALFDHHLVADFKLDAAERLVVPFCDFENVCYVELDGQTLGIEARGVAIHGDSYVAVEYAHHGPMLFHYSRATGAKTHARVHAQDHAGVLAVATDGEHAYAGLSRWNPCRGGMMTHLAAGITVHGTVVDDNYVYFGSEGYIGRIPK